MSRLVTTLCLLVFGCASSRGDVGDSSTGAADGWGGAGGSSGTCGDDPNPTDSERLLISLPADTWFAVPGSTLKASPACVPDSFGVGGVDHSCAGVIGYSGGAWDPAHRMMLLWGGGHNGYWGNEVYGFDLRRFEWQRLTEPTQVSADNQSTDPLYDGNPVSRHTYDQLQYIVHANRFWGFGGAMATNGFSTYLTWALEIESKRWQNRMPAGAPRTVATGTYNAATAYDPVTKKIFYCNEAGFAIYDYDANTWSTPYDFGYPPYYPDFSVYGPKRGTIDTRRRLFYALGGAGDATRGQRFVYDIDRSQAILDYWHTTGDDGGIMDGYGPGIDYDMKADQLVGWNGGAPRALDLVTQVWTARSGIGAPAALFSTGTYGRWRYLPEYNVFILINNLYQNENVMFYKNRAGCG